ncbi:receptor-like serine/threonine-protein kinase SD1-8 isoform X2 [Quercus robur]|uniref:receptor-like serine/threonine-protein kinase SD1-8 isoform X2 n=1 Tax=Quercus robur TaxID=38942 RepID=UPI002163A910|nr:receptor-like serine/threonine-protein kinase SD1-8 isoform X2 [Quercus robur]
MDIFALVFLSSSLLVFSFVSSDAVDSITQSQTLRDIENTTLVSKDGGFVLGFFSPGNSNNRYLGIWYNNIPVKTVVWVANRLNPIPDSSGVLMVKSSGSLVLLSQNTTVAWSANSTKEARNPIVHLLDSGNLVSREENEDNYLWQSFDYPSDTWLPGMKLGWDLGTGLEKRLTEWKSLDDPSPGEMSWGIELNNYPELVMKKGSEKYFRSGPWNGIFFSGMPELQATPLFNYTFVSNKDEVHFMFELIEISTITRVALSQSQYMHFVWVDEKQKWMMFLSFPKDGCDAYNFCGAYGNCIVDESLPCHCVEGFKPVSRGTGHQEEWYRGCVGITQLSCEDKDKIGFFKLPRFKMPATTYSWLNESMSLNECRVKCLNNCSCTAYANSDIRGGGSGCAIWFGDLTDIRQMAANKEDANSQDVYIRMPTSEQANSIKKEVKNKQKTKVVVIVVVAIAVIFGVLMIPYSIWKRSNFRDPIRHEIKDWATRTHIIEGIVQGLLYLHQYSRLQIIHRDLKASNILLDKDMNPKISDFGLARIFCGNGSQATNRIVGTYGYMSPEYAMEGLFSIKSDVFSFGVLLLEILSGKKNTGFYQSDSINLIGYTWDLWKSNRSLELMDPILEDTPPANVLLSYINIALLCVQENAVDRPTISDVISMFNKEPALLPSPKKPAFSFGRGMEDLGSSKRKLEICSLNDMTVSILEAR